MRAHAHTYACFEAQTDGHAVAQLVMALRYKPEGRGFGPQWSFLPYSVCNRNECQVAYISMGIKAAAAWG
jgi:hypothetical protein